MDASLKEKYVEKCKDLVCEPGDGVLTIMENAAAQGDECGDLILCGSRPELFKNRMDGMQICALAESLIGNTQITHLDLSYNFISDAGAQTIAHLLKMNKTLKYVNLSGNEITSPGAKSLAAVIASPGRGEPSGIEMISMNGNPIGDEGTMGFADMLKHNSTLRLLDLGHTDTAEKGIISICFALSSENSSLQILNLDRPIIKGPKDYLMMHLAKMIGANTSLRHLKLGKFGMVDSEFDTLVAYGLTKNNTITALDLRGNQLSGFSGESLGRLLGENQVIETINLASNRLGDSGAEVIAKSLLYNNILTFLDLRNNGINETGLLSLAESIHLSNSLSSVFVWGNGFGPTACRAFMDLLQRFSDEGRAFCIDLEPYEVDGEVKVALVDVTA